MNRIYRLVWNRALRVLQVASEFAQSHGGSADGEGAAPLHRRPLALACALVLGLALGAAPQLAAAQTVGASGGNASGTTGGTGSTGSNGGGNGNGSYGNGGNGGGTSGSGGGGGINGTHANGGTSTGGGGGGTGYGYAAWTTGGAGGAGGGLSSAGYGGGGGGGAAEGGSGGGGGGGGSLGTTFSGVATTSTSVTGGAGGSGSNGSGGGYIYTGGGGGGGGGGAGALLTASGSLTNSATITGGAGGNGGAGAGWGASGGGGGGGGAGLLMDTSGTLDNTGTIQGGNGGTGQQRSGGGGSGIYAAGNDTIDNHGTISGGLNGGVAGQYASAIQFNGTGNTLNLYTGSTINGALQLLNNSAATITAQDSGLTLSSNILLGTGSSVTGDTGTDDLGISGVISGSGSLTKQGGGTLTLTGINTYTGGTTIGAGTLQVGDGTANGALGTGNVTDNAALVFDNATTTTIANAISGTGAATQEGPGTLIYTGTSTGVAWTVTSGTLQVGNSSTSKTGTINAPTFTDNASVVVDGAGSSVTATASSMLVGGGGTGMLTVQNGALVHSDSELEIGQLAGDTGTVTVTGSGSTVSTDASINIGQYGTGTLVVSAGGTVSDNGYFSVADQASATGTVIVTGAGSSITAQAAAVGNHAGTGTMTLADSGSFTSSSGLVIAQDAGSIGTVNIGAAAGDTAAAAGTLDVSEVAFGDGTGTLVFNHTNSGYVFAPYITGAGTVEQLAGTTILTADNDYSGGTTISGGTLQVGDGGTAGSLGTGGVTDNGTLAFDRSDAVDFTGALAGTGTLVQQGSGTLTLDGNSSSFAGNTTVATGTLIVGSTAGNGAALGGDVTVDNGATLGGHGTIGGSVDVLAGGTVTPGNSVGTLTVGGDFTAAQGSVLDFDVGAPGANFQTAGSSDSVHVGGNLELDGATLNVTNAGGMGPGLYNLFTWGGTLTENSGGIMLGTTPGGQSLFLQTLTAQQQINLIDTTGYTVDAWNANGQASATQMGGGSGTWSVTSQVWTDAAGTTPNGPMSPQPGFALFGGTAGTVTVDGGANAVSATGLQFAVDGYTLTGDTLTLVASNGSAPVIRVGDGSSNGAGMSATIGNVIAGSDGLVKTDLGTLVLAGANTYTGGTTISAGTLQIGNGGLTGSITGNVTDNGTLAFNLSSTTTFAGIVSGNGALVQAGSGTLILTGANSYTGGTTINAGTLVASSASLPGNVVNNAALVFDQESDSSFAGVISGTGNVAKTGSGTLVLDSDSSAFAGTTTVQAGTLEVGDAATPAAALGGNVTVDAGATLRGHGTVGGDVGNGGTVWAGGSIGTLTIQGNYTQAANGVLEVEAAPDGQASLLAVGGKATLAGSALLLADAGNWAPRTAYTILTAAGGVSGQFAVASANLAFLDPVLTYEANDVLLSLERNDLAFSGVAQTPNQKAVAATANPLGFGNPIYDALVVLDAPAARHAFDQLSGEIHASTRTAIVDNDHYVRDAINQHLAGQRNNANGLNVTDADGVTAWTATWGHWGNHDGNGNASTLDDNGSGLLLGVDMPVGGTARFGAVMGTGQGTARVGALGSSSHIVDQHLGVYGSMQTGALQWQGGAIYGWQKVDTNRSISFGTLDGSAVSSYHAHTAQAYIDASLPFVQGSTTLAPFANLAVERLSTPTIQENGTPAAVDVAGQDSTSGYGTLGLRASFDLGAPNHGLHAHASLGWQHAWGDLLPVDTMRFESGGDSFAIAGLPALRNASVFNAGISFTIAPNVSVDGSYQGQFGQHATDQSARISLDWKF